MMPMDPKCPQRFFLPQLNKVCVLNFLSRVTENSVSDHLLTNDNKKPTYPKVASVSSNN